MTADTLSATTPRHPCLWCHEETAAILLVCARCQPLEQEGYRRAHTAGVLGWADVYAYVLAVLREHGVVS